MKIIYNFLLFCLAFFYSLTSISQNIDSLKRVVDTEIDLNNKYELSLEYGNRLRSKDPDQALHFFQIAHKIAEDQNDKLKIAENIKNFGIVFYFKEDLNTSSRYYFKALETLNEKDSSNFKLISEIHNNIAWNFERMANYDQGIAHFEIAVNYAGKLEDKSLLGLIYNNLGVLYKNIGDLEKAIFVYEKSYIINVDSENIERQLFNLNNIGVIYIEKKKYNKAYEYISKALKLNYELGNEIEIVNNLGNISSIYSELGLFEKAKDSLLSALKIAHKSNFGEGKIMILSLLSETEAKLFNFEQSLVYYKAFDNLQDSIFRQEQNKFLLESETKYQSLKKEKENEILKQQSIITTNELRQSRLINIFFVVGFIIISILAFLLFRLLATRKKANKILIKLNKQIHSQKEEIENQSEELKVVNEDISERNEKLRISLTDLKNTQAQLIQSEKMASLGLLASGIGHEINNPLNFIFGGVETLKNSLKNLDDKIISEIKPYTDIIDEGVFRTTKIIKSLSHFSRQSASMNENCDIHDILENCLIMLQNNTKHRIEIQKNFSTNGLTIIGNEGKLHQAFLNILSNAEQAIEEEGKITISTIENPQNFEIKIIDNGKGISEENISKINDPFFTTKDPGKGTGLGMSITYVIIQEHNGSIHAKSKLNEGTSITIKIPKQ